MTTTRCLMATSSTFLLYMLLLFVGFHVHNINGSTIENLTAQEFYFLILNDSIDAIIDVRSQSEWDSGHIEGAMLVESLASYGDSESQQVTTPIDLAGCEYCDIIVYCRSGNRASVALKLLQNAGFKGQLYNGQGVRQWTEANYTLVNTSSIAAPCTYNQTLRDEHYTRWVSYQSTGTVIASNSGSFMIRGFSGLLIIGFVFASSMLL
jgi:rhodanese-related sulfurtransferase